jgi:hypothetical protein
MQAGESHDGATLGGLAGRLANRRDARTPAASFDGAAAHAARIRTPGASGSGRMRRGEPASQAWATGLHPLGEC